jgi:3-phosphoshikimate 1-carboxyvinyltransferase
VVGNGGLKTHANPYHSKPDQMEIANAIVRAMASTTDAAVVPPARRVAGRTRVPGDKSISHRYAMLAALADGVSVITGYSPGADCAATLACVRALGATVRHTGDRTFEIEGRGLRGFRPPPGPLDAANSGTTMRLMSGILAAHRMQTTIGGDRSLSKRPMQRVIEPLTRMGARIDSDDGRPPLTITGADLHPIDYAPAVPSAQVKSAVILAGLQTEGRTSVTEPAATRDHTERALASFGAHVEVDGLRVAIDGGQRLHAATLPVPGDISSATFWMALAAGTPGASVEVEGVGLNPSRTDIVALITRAGAMVSTNVETAGDGEPIGRLVVAFGTPRSFAIEPGDVPGIIDEIPALAALAAMMPDGTELVVRGAAELRHKESDRITALARGLRAMGAEVDEFPDGFQLRARPLHGATVDACDDHRLAMAFAIAATRASTPTTILGASAVDVSYPGFFETLDRLTRGDGR